MFDIKLLKERIRFFRNRSGLTQTELAEKIGVSFQAVSNWETGSTVPDLENLCALSTLFGVSLDSLLKAKEGKEERYLIAVDGGGTKSEFVLFSSCGRVVKNFILTGTNASVIGVDEAVRILCQGIDTCLKEIPSVAGIFIGNAGKLEDLRNILSKRYPKIPLRIENDSINALYCADCDAALICGTGSILIIKDGEKYRTVGGWGYRIGDPCSAYNFGIRAFKNAMQFEDGICADPTIHSLLTKKMGVFKIHGEFSGKSQSYIASMAPVIFDAFEQGNEIAKEIIDSEIKELSAIIAASVPDGAKIVAGGGIMSHFNKILIPRLKQAINKNVEFVLPDAPLVYGACVAGCHELGIETSKNFEDNFLNSYESGAIK